MVLECRGAVGWAVALVGFFTASTACAQKSLPVSVIFDFGQVKRLKDHPKAAETELAIAKHVIQCLKKADYQEYFPWNFEANQRADCPKLKLTLIEDPQRTRWELFIQAFKENGAAPDKFAPIQRSVSQPGDMELIRRTPKLAEFPDAVVEWLEAKFLVPDSGREVHRLLKEVAPLGVCQILSKHEIPRSLDQAEGVLLLDWDKFAFLSKSVFFVLCQDKDQALVELVSVGDRKRSEYELAAASGRKCFGIAVKHKKWNDAEISQADLPKLYELTLGRVYLEEYSGFHGVSLSSDLQATDQ